MSAATRAADRVAERNAVHMQRIRRATTPAARFGAARGWLLAELAAARRAGRSEAALVDPVVTAISTTIMAQQHTERR